MQNSKGKKGEFNVNKFHKYNSQHKRNYFNIRVISNPEISQIRSSLKILHLFAKNT